MSFSNLEIADTSHYLLHCHHLYDHRIDLINSVNSIISKFESINDNRKTDILLYGDPRFEENKKKHHSGSNHKLKKFYERFTGSYFELKLNIFFRN